MCRPDKVMKETYFEGITWTKTFASGSLNYLTLSEKGHLRKDQRWRYEYLRTTELTCVVTHALREPVGHNFTPMELLKELRLFMNTPHVDIGDKYPFYNDYITTPNRELCVFQEFRKIGFCDYQNVFSRNEEKVNFKVPPVGRKNSDNNISSAKMKFSRNEENVLWILHINNNI